MQLVSSTELTSFTRLSLVYLTMLAGVVWLKDKCIHHTSRSTNNTHNSVFSQISTSPGITHTKIFRNVMLSWEELPNKHFPIIFHPVYGKDEREANSPSFFNVAEVETIERYLKKLLDDSVRSKGLKHLRPEMIGVISPYKRQVGDIRLYEGRHLVVSHTQRHRCSHSGAGEMRPP